MPGKNSTSNLHNEKNAPEESRKQNHKHNGLFNSRFSSHFLSHIFSHTYSHIHSYEHSHFHEHSHGHSHTHGRVDPSITTTSKGLWAVKWSFIGLMITAVLQIFIVYISGSVALLADTIHNFGDASTAIPLAIAFSLARKKPSKRFSYGYGRAEDLAGVIIVILILFSAAVAGYESLTRFLNPQPVDHLQAVALAAIIGCIGNEIVAEFRMKVGKEIGSAALIADGYHARVDGFTSLAVLLGAIGVWSGFPVLDPLIGMLITIAILKIVLDSSKLVFTRLLDGVEPEVLDKVKDIAESVDGVCEVTDLRVRWIGHRLHAEINASVDPSLSVEEGHEIANAVREKLLENFSYLSGTTIHVDPLTASGECCHCVPAGPEKRKGKQKRILNVYPG
ncbi:cation diffusion facilitator family transporter [Methanosarcina mazei]|uniref:Cation transporter n=1 Tax=Methanosarcina mazei TaxID=2209 RepID=A0A0F8ECB3_METMZ|nr:cation diffusion facilitator family transporter [Methanosarcina mazei]KKG02757.1 cation transporter [Methanosarcina mazei]KKG29366.1 cation transporter [Methanosarcina mazei]KKG38322.1 cation transporter [Methanosarcina mazei]KKG38493.1 cation transporter [Methanosarcina mazei]KKG39846.1 cation transporter [Methanosarcina mazei]